MGFPNDVAIIIFIFAALGAWRGVHGVASFIEQDCLQQGQRQALQERFEAWWASIAAKPPRDFVLGILQKTSELLGTFFGSRLFSQRAFRRTTWISISLLMAAIVTSGLTGSGLQPWKTYEGFLKQARVMNEKEQTDLFGKSGPEVDARRKANAMMFKLVKECDKWGWELLYCTMVYVGMVGGTAVAFFVTVGVSRMALAEIAASGRPTTAIFVLLLNLYLSVSTIGAFMLFTETLASPLMWCGLLVTCLLAQVSLYWVIVGAFNLGLAAWVFGGTLLRMAGIIVVLPCLATIACCLFALIALRKRDLFHKVCCWVLKRCATEKAVSFMVGSVGLAVILIATVSRLLMYLVKAT